MPQGTGRRRGIVLVGLLGVALAGCDVEWGGSQISLEDPAPPPDSTAVSEPLEPEQVPLPAGPYVHLVRLEPDGAALLTPLGEIARGNSAPVFSTEIPDGDPTFRIRFDSAFLAPENEMDLLARGGRIGTVILGTTIPDGGSCLSISRGQAIVAPGQDVPAWAFAVPRGSLPLDPPRRIPPLDITSSMSVAGPVLAERLIASERAFLARRVALTAVEVPGDTLSGMAATYLVADSLAAGPPGDRAISLFFMARFEPARGFIPIWSELRRYGSGENKEAFEYVDGIPWIDGRLDMVKRYDGSSVRLAASRLAEGTEPKIVWVEPAGCEALERLGSN